MWPKVQWTSLQKRNTIGKNFHSMATYSDVNNGHKRKQFLQFGFHYASMLNIPSSSFHKKTMNICTITWCWSGRQDNCNGTFISYASCCCRHTHIIYCIKGVVTLFVTVWSDQLTWHCNFKYIITTALDNVTIQHWWNCNWQGKTKLLWRMSTSKSLYPPFHVDNPETEPGACKWQAGDCLTYGAD